MCLDYQFKPETIKKRKAALPKGLITVYKIVQRYTGRYRSIMRSFNYRKGLNVATGDSDLMLYDPGFHSYTTERGARQSGWRGVIVKFQIRKTWITTMGVDHGMCYITDRIICPSVNDESAIVR